MKILFIIALYLVCIILFAFAALARRDKTVISNNISLLLLCGAVTCILYGGSVISYSERVSGIFSGMYYGSVSLLLLAFLSFTTELTGYFRKKWAFHGAFAFLALCDIAVLQYLSYKNILAHFVKQHIAFSRDMWIATSWHPYFAAHLSLCYVMCLIIILCLIVKTSVSPAIYKKKYYIMLLAFALILVLDGISIALKLYFDLAVFAYALLGLLVYFFGIKYVPEFQTTQLIKLIFEDFEDMVFCFDMDHKCSYVNRTAFEFLRFENPMDIFQKRFDEWRRDTPGFDEWGTEKHIWTMRIGYSVSTALEISCQKNYDEINNYLGCYFLVRDKTAEIKEFENRHKQIIIDPSTDIYRREYFFDMVSKILDANREKKYLFICSNISDFKVYNAIFGEEQGDRVIRTNGNLIKSAGRVAEVYGHVSNDVFGMLIEKDKYEEKHLTDALRAMQEEFSTPIYKLKIMAGVYEITSHSEPVASMCAKAGLAIKKEEEDSDTFVYYYDAREFDEMVNEKYIINRFEQAMSDMQFVMYLQPQVTGDGRVMGGEALARWIDDEGKIIPSHKFIPVLESSGLIVSLDKYIWDCAARKLWAWKKLGREDVYISINISVKDFYYIDIYKELTDLVYKYNINPINLKLEVTETVMTQDILVVDELLQKLRHFGFEIALDDFGSGYASLGLLKDVTADTLKIDISFISQASNQQENRMWIIMTEMLELARKLGMKTIVEGIESSIQFARLEELGCRVYQGYYFARPESEKDFERRVGIR